MFKLLTEEESDKVKGEYVMRRAIVVLLLFIFVLFAGIIGLLPSYVLSNARYNEVLERTRITDSLSQHGGEFDPVSWLIKINNDLKILSPTLDTDSPREFIDQVLSRKVAGVRITSFSWVKDAGVISLSISGISKDRQTLIAFENSINASGFFSNVTLPISNLAKDKDIDFQMKFAPSPSQNKKTP